MKKPRTLTQAKKSMWNTFSRYIRLRDCLRTTGCSSFGLCITCGKRYHIKLLQAGHFVPGRHNANLFNDMGCHSQCYNCNINLRGNTLEYRRQIIKLYGEGAPEEIEELDKQTLKFTVAGLEEMEKTYKEKIKELENNE